MQTTDTYRDFQKNQFIVNENQRMVEVLIRQKGWTENITYYIDADLLWFGTTKRKCTTLQDFESMINQKSADYQQKSENWNDDEDEASIEEVWDDYVQEKVLKY